MTQKHHNLLVDAIVDGAAASKFNSYIKTHLMALQKDCSTEALHRTTDLVVQAVARDIASNLAKKLFYTNDKFDEGRFMAHVRNGLENDGK